MNGIFVVLPMLFGAVFCGAIMQPAAELSAASQESSGDTTKVSGKAQMMEQVAELVRAYMTPERIAEATSLVNRAIEKYANMQAQPTKEESQKSEQE